MTLTATSSRMPGACQCRSMTCSPKHFGALEFKGSEAHAADEVKKGGVPRLWLHWLHTCAEG